MSLLSFSKNSSGRTFALSLTIFTFYCLTNVLRWLPVVNVQLPIIVFCYILLLNSCGRNSEGQSRIFFLTVVMIVFDYFFVFLQGGMRNESIINSIGANYTIFVSFFPMLYVVSGNLAKIDRAKFMKFIYLLSFITAVTTIVGTYMYESPCRELATPDNLEMDRLYKQHNIGGYGFIYFIALLIPIILRDLFQKYSFVKSLLLVTLLFCVLRAEYTTALLLTLVGVALVLVIQSKSKVLKLAILGAVIAAFVALPQILVWSSENLADSSFTMSKRFEMVSDYNDYGETDDDLGMRIFLYRQSLDAFVTSPVFGNLIRFQGHHQLGGHSEILDFIGGSGLFGLFVLSLILHYLKHQTPLSRINTKDPFIKSTMIVALVLALINTFLTPELYFAILIVPLLVDYNSKLNRK